MNTKGPSETKLIARRLALELVPVGSGKSAFGAGLANLIDPERFKEAAKRSAEWVEAAIQAVRSAPDCPFQSNEEIATHLLNEIEKRERAEIEQRMPEHFRS